jgi:allantoate deiminase
LDLDWHIARDHPAVACNPEIAGRLAQAVADSGNRVERLPSGAGHDAVTMAAVVPVGMLFVRCAGGISHHPAESVTAEDVAVAIDVLDRFLASLANQGRP